MGLLDIASLLAPLSGEIATGEDLEYDKDFIELELNAQGTPDRVELVKDPDSGRDSEKIVPGKEPNPKEVLDTALSLFKRTKDLRVAMHVAYGATRIDGLPGLASATELISLLLTQFWDEIHPRLDADDPDPFMRINILNGFVDPAKLLRALKNAPLAEARAIGRFTLRDIEVAYGEASALEGQAAATKELLHATCIESDQAVLAERLAACKAALANLKAIVSIFNERTTSYPDFGALKKLLDRAVALYEGVAQTSATEDVAVESNTESGYESAAKSVSGKIASRSDAKKMLEQVCVYLEQSEPAHPSPLLLRRAIRLLDMNFLDIMRELTPGVVSEIEQLGGIRNE
jgi:type VI secretion system protein ImpA